VTNSASDKPHCKQQQLLLILPLRPQTLLKGSSKLLIYSIIGLVSKYPEINRFFSHLNTRYELKHNTFTTQTQ